MADSNLDSDSKQLDSDSDSDSDSRKIRWIQIHVDSDSRLLDSDPDSDSRCPDSHITGSYLQYFVRYKLFSPIFGQVKSRQTDGQTDGK